MATTTKHISKYANVIDSRDVINRIEHLEDKSDSGLNATELEELQALLALRKEASASPDWEHGEMLISDAYFPQYARELAEDLGDVRCWLYWPFTCVDWDQAARELQVDYVDVEYMGQTFWIRA